MLKIELPDLDSQTDVEIVKDNLHAAQAIYFAFQLEELRLFQVAERIVELFHQGLLPIGRGRAGEVLFQIWRSRPPQPESVRRNAYWRMFGAAPGGAAAEGEPNSDFLSLQRIERFNGLVILATNLRDDIDTPFAPAARHRWRAVRFPLLSQ